MEGSANLVEVHAFVGELVAHVVFEHDCPDGFVTPGALPRGVVEVPEDTDDTGTGGGDLVPEGGEILGPVGRGGDPIVLVIVGQEGIVIEDDETEAKGVDEGGVTEVADSLKRGPIVGAR